MKASRERWMAGAIALGLLGLWELLARAGAISELFFPAPSRIALAALAQARSGELALHLGATLRRTGLGLLLAAGLGLPIGWLAGGSERARRLLDPWIAAVHPIPKVAIFPLFMVLLGVGDRAAVVAVAAGAFFPIVLSTLAGVDEIPPACFEVARTYGASRLRILRRVLIPGSLPGALIGLRLAANVALVITIAVELVGEGRGLGSRIWLAWETFRIEDLWAYLAVIAALGIGLVAALGQVARWLVPWRRSEPEADRVGPDGRRRPAAREGVWAATGHDLKEEEIG